MKNFLKNTSGNVATTFAILVIPLMLSAGAALDYSEYARKQSSLQNVSDAAALAVALDLQKLSQSEVEAKVDAFFQSNLSAQQYAEIQNVIVDIPISKERVTVTVTGKHPTSLMRLAGINTLSYSPESTVSAPVGKAEIMLVLDTTGSMELDGKIDQLKVSAKTFVEENLQANALRERVTIGITPFARYVNVGLDNRSAPWMDVPDDYSVTTTITKRDLISSSGCTDSTYTDDEGLEQTRTTCANEVFGPEYTTERTRNFNWRGCAGSRDYPLNLQDQDYNTKVPGLLKISCPNRLTQLTNDETKLKDEIDALSPSGSTYIPSGLTWGWRALSDGKPFDDGVSYTEADTKSVNKIIVLMSDGENQSSINPTDKTLHNGNDSTQANQYTKEVCDNIKAKGITLFTIGFGSNIPTATLNLLKECSTDGNYYYNAIDGASLTAAFSDITSSLTSLYLSE